MSPPRKRPRLHFLGSLSPETEQHLEYDRCKNDRLLKTKFESVFLKYDRDFEGQADEISMWTGDIVVDNGHISGMKSDQETGEVKIKKEDEDGDTEYGSRLLRAMTEAPDARSIENIGADHVLESIETIAQNTLAYSDESEDDLFGTKPSQSPYALSRKRHALHDQHRNFSQHDELISQSLSGLYHDSAYDDEFAHYPQPFSDSCAQQRSPSVDSLFGTVQQTRPYTSTPPHLEEVLTPQDDVDPALQIHIPTQQEVMEQYKPLIRQQIQEALNEQKELAEMNVEPAWRLPRLPVASQERANLSTKRNLSAMQENIAQAAPAGPGGDVAVNKDDAENDNIQDIWYQPPARRQRRTKHELQADRAKKKIRLDSEDPLHDGFTSEPEQVPARLPSTTKSRRKPSSAQRAKARPSQQTTSRSTEPPDRQPDMAEPDNDQTQSQAEAPHHSPGHSPPCDHRQPLANVPSQRRGRPPKTLISDFKILIQLHEHAQMSFDAIAAAQPFSVDKSPSRLEEEYTRHRTPKQNRAAAAAASAVKWTRAELKILRETCRSVEVANRTTMGMLQTKLCDKSYVDIGERVAGMARAEMKHIAKADVLDSIKSKASNTNGSVI